MLTRRGFLKGFLASVAAAALVKNGVIRPEQVIAEPKPWTIDMAANTWRREGSTSMAMIWDGHLAHVAVWDRILTAKEEVASLQEPLFPWMLTWRTYKRAVLASAPIAYWPLYEDRLGYMDAQGEITIVSVPSA